MEGISPRYLIFDHGVEDDKELSHGGDQRDHFLLSSVHEALVEGFELGVVTDGCDGGHVERFADLHTSSAGGPFAAQGSTVAVGGSDSDEPGDLLPVELSELGKLGDESGGGRRSDADDGLQEFGFGLERLILLNEFFELIVDLLELPVVELKGLLDPQPDIGIEGGGQPVLLLDPHALDLLPAAEEILDFLLIFRGWRRGSGLHSSGEQSDDPGIDGIGFGQLPCGSGEVPNLPGIHNSDAESELLKLMDKLPFQSSGGFEADQFGLERLQPVDESGEPVDGVLEALDFGAIGESDIEMAFADIDPDAAGLKSRSERRHASDPSLQIRAGGEARPLWRLFGLRRKTAMAIRLRDGLCDPGPDDPPPRDERAGEDRPLRQTIDDRHSNKIQGLGQPANLVTPGTTG